MATRRRGRKRSSTSGHGVILLLPRTSVTENRKSSPTKSRSYLSKGVRNLFPQGGAFGYADESGEPWGREHEERRAFQREGNPQADRRQPPPRFFVFLNVSLRPCWIARPDPGTRPRNCLSQVQTLKPEVAEDKGSIRIDSVSLKVCLKVGKA